jgi:hypothetical protein
MCLLALLARDAGQRFVSAAPARTSQHGLPTIAPAPANQADRADRTCTFRVIGVLLVRRLIRNVRPHSTRMGFEVFIFSFKNGEPAGFPIQRIRDAFGAFVADSPGYAWRLCYDGPNLNGVTVMRHPTDQSLLHGFTVDSPGSDLRLWDTLASILAFGPLAMVFSSGGPPLIGSADVVPDLPPSMIESMGQPKCVRSGSEILHAIQSAS